MSSYIAYMDPMGYSHMFQSCYDLSQLPRDGWPENYITIFIFSPPSTYDQKP